MTNELTTYNFADLELRVIMHMAEPWFVLMDVCRALELAPNKGGYGLHTRKLGADEIAPVSELGAKIPGTRGNAVKLVSESGLYKLIMRSDKPEARKFQDWVTREVLPAIRKTGGYLLNEEARDAAKADDRQAMPLPVPTNLVPGFGSYPGI